MGKNLIKTRIILSFLILFPFLQAFPQTTNSQDTLTEKKERMEKYDQFYDSLEYKANKNKLTRLLHHLVFSNHNKDKMDATLDYYEQMEGKIISDIQITALDVFGPTLEDTTRKAKSWLEKTANSIHTKSNLNTIRKMLLFKVGDFVDPELLYENERIIRSLPYIKDIRFILEQDSVYSGLVTVHVITKDRF